jgi:hypothetical protein
LVLFSYSEQGLIRRSHCEEAVHIEQESRSFDRPHFLVYGIQKGDPGREGDSYYTYYTYHTYIYYVNYTIYIHYTNYCVSKTKTLAENVFYTYFT